MKEKENTKKENKTCISSHRQATKVFFIRTTNVKCFKVNY